jgi:iron(III) transport system substrate-binding protein
MKVSFADINVVTDRSDFHLKSIFDSFTDITGIDINAVYLKKGTIPARIESGADNVDVIIATDIASLSKLTNDGYIQSMKSDVIDSLDDKFVNEYYVALSYRARTMVYSRDRIDVNDLVGYEDLANPKYKGRVCMRPFLHTYNIVLVSEMIEDRGEAFARNWVRGVANNLAVPPSGNDRKQAKLVASGICDISLMNTYYFGLLLSNNEQREIANSVQLFFPNQDRGGTYVLYSGVAIPRTSRNIEEAQRLVDFLLSYGAQAIISNVTFEYPVIDIDFPVIVKGFGEGQEGVEEGVAKFNFVSPGRIFRNRELAVEILASFAN